MSCSSWGMVGMCKPFAQAWSGIDGFFFVNNSCNVSRYTHVFLQQCSLFVIGKECVATDYADPLMSHV